MIGGPEVMIIIAAIFLGKETARYYKAKFLDFFKREGPPKPVSRTRYYIGLTLILASIIPIYIAGYIPPDIIPWTEEEKVFILLSMDILFVISFFIAGPDFWEKIKSLFVYKKNL